MNHFYYTGGVAMNVKANKKIMELDCSEIYVRDHLMILVRQWAPLYPLTDNLQPQFRSVGNMYLGESFLQKYTRSKRVLLIKIFRF